MEIGGMAGTAGGPSGSVEDTDVLLADDEPLFTLTLRDILVDQGYRVVTAGDGRAALDMARHHRPALAFLDLAMPEMDGESVCRALMADPRHPRVVIVTADAPEEQVSRLLGLGALAVVLKPASVAHLLRFVAESCGTRAVAGTG